MLGRAGSEYVTDAPRQPVNRWFGESVETLPAQTQQPLACRILLTAVPARHAGSPCAATA